MENSAKYNQLEIPCLVSFKNIHAWVSVEIEKPSFPKSCFKESWLLPNLQRILS